jgi:hypothetical protein
VPRFYNFLCRDFTIFFKEDPNQSVILCCLDSELLKEPQSNTLSVSYKEMVERMPAKQKGAPLSMSRIIA